MNKVLPNRTRAEWKSAKEKNIVNSLAMGHPFFVAHAKGAEIWDLEGRRFIDFAGGIGVMNIGHSHQKVVEAVKRQVELFQHTCFPVMPYTSYIQLAEKMNALVPGNFPKKTFLINTGVEAVENAIKIARIATKRRIVISFAGAFHGRTTLGINLTGKLKPYKFGFGAWGGDVFRVPFPNPVHGITFEDTKKAFQQYFKNDFDPSEVAAILIEPVQGEGGYLPAPVELMAYLRKLTKENGIVLIIDEVQSGFGRCGKMFALEKYIEQSKEEIGGDIFIYAKSFAAGLPLAGVTGRADIMDAPPLGALGSTYGGNPSAIAAALAVIEVFGQEPLLERSQQLGQKLVDRLKAWQSKIPELKDVRGLGSMVGAEFWVEGSPEKGGEFVKNVVQKAEDKGLILLSCGMYSNVLRFMYPLSISDTLFDEALQILERSISEVRL